MHFRNKAADNVMHVWSWRVIKARPIKAEGYYSLELQYQYNSSIHT